MLINIIEEIAVGTVIALVSSMIVWLYHIRQLYASAPVLFQNHTDDSQYPVYQIVISNRGNQVEENVRVELDPSVQANIVASSLTDVILVNHVIHIMRIHKKQEVNLLLQIRSGFFDSSKILSVSSNETTGKICKSPHDIPFNYGVSALIISLLIGICPIFYYTGQIIDYVTDKLDERNLSGISNQGWGNLDAYQESDLRKSYSDNEFPVRLLGIRKKSDYSDVSIPDSLKRIWPQLNQNSLLLNYEVNNKTASDLGVLAFRQGAYNTPPFYRNVPPMSKAVIIIPVRTVPASGNIRIEFMFRLHADWMDRIDHTFNPAILDGTVIRPAEEHQPSGKTGTAPAH